MTGILESITAFVVALILNAMIATRIRAGVVPEEAPFLVRVYWSTLWLRFGLAVFLNMYSGSATFADMWWGDSSTYDWGGSLLALSWSGVAVVNPFLERAVSGYGFFYFVGAIYSVFGQNQLLVQFLNGTIGAVTLLVVYAIAKTLFDVEVARWAARFLAFFPGVIFWSAAMYKDPAIMLCIAVCMYAVLQLRERMTFRHVVLYIGAALVLMTLRFYVFYFVVFATLGTFVFTQRRTLIERLFVQGVLVGVFLTAFSFAAGTETFEQHMSYFTLQKIAVVRQDQAMWGESAFTKQGEDVTTAGGAWATLPRGLLFLLFAPFPWHLMSLRQALTLPETLVWYGLMPAFVRGLVYTVRLKLAPALPILVFTAALTVAYGLFQGNIGTAYRQRTQITMFFFIFMGAGIVVKKRQRERARQAFTPEPAFASVRR